MVFSNAAHFIEEYRLPHTAEPDEQETPGEPARPVPLECNVGRSVDVIVPGKVVLGREAGSGRIAVRE
ncbi:MAG: hypothetical protein OXI81_20470 [Paracoccaceae bacterium]|nr:hypothetical protein [Paracoccaceae bacterium]MDE2912140.1 hypothetical protein [Paracoccaceae bacterium]